MKPELLAPAGSPASLRAAVEAGADSVYMGALWNARLRARNFSPDELARAISYCHQNGVKAYVALNIMVFESELGRVAEYIRHVYEGGADALIVQDLGVAAMARQIAPDLPLHASTQLSTHNSQSAKKLKAMGFSRLILARELAVEQAVQIKKNAGIEVESFCHGALCYSYSGKCFFSFAQTGRSANRGACAQICRFPWKLYSDGRFVKSGYLTSTKDLNTLADVPKIAQAGVDCIKIEGRLKDGAYVRAIVSAYRKAIDSGETADLSAYTSRGYTGGYLFGDAKKNKLTNPQPHSFLGGEIGKVLSNGRNGAQIELCAPLKKGDSIRSSSSGKILEVFRLYVNGREVERADKKCTLLIKTLKAGDTLFSATRAKIEDDVLEGVPVESKRKAKDFAPQTVSLSFAPVPKLFFAPSKADLSKAPATSAVVVSMEDAEHPLFEKGRFAGVVVDTPRVVFDEEMAGVKKRMDELSEEKPLAFMASEPALVAEYPTIASPYANLSNTYAVCEFAAFGNLVHAVASVELAGAEAKRIGLLPFTGRSLELMISENDLFFELGVKEGALLELEDPNKNRFRILRKSGRTVVLKANHAPR